MQSNSSAEMAAGIEEMSANFSQPFEVAEQTKLAAEGSSTESESGPGLVESTSADVEKTAAGAIDLSQTLQELGAQSEQISQIISVIEQMVGAIQKGTQNVVSEMTGWAEKVSFSLGRMSQTKHLMGTISNRAGSRCRLTAAHGKQPQAGRLSRLVLQGHCNTRQGGVITACEA